MHALFGEAAQALETAVDLGRILGEGSLRRRRSAAGAQNTRSLILDTAEQLFAARGVESVSLRQIGIAAGCANHFVVQYHFGDKNQLVTAIYERRLASLEGRRAKLMAVVRQNNKLNNVRALMEVLLRPLADEVNAQGSCSYAAFLLSSFHLGLTTTLPAPHLAPLTDHVVDLLYAANDHVARDLS